MTTECNDERRPILPATQSVREFGRSKDLIACPFCQVHVWAYRWSRAGSGKRCQCGAILYMREAMRSTKPSKVSSKRKSRAWRGDNKR